MNKFFDKIGSLPGVATVLTGVVGAYIALVAFGNITDYDSNEQFVRGVLGMETTFDDPDLMWRAIENDTLQTIGYIGIIAAETVAAILILWGFVLMLKAFSSGAWRHARNVASTGILLMMFIFGFGFIVMGGEWFSMWQSSQFNGLSAAIRNFTLAGFTMVLLHLPSKDWDEA